MKFMGVRLNRSPKGRFNREEFMKLNVFYIKLMECSVTKEISNIEEI